MQSNCRYLYVWWCLNLIVAGTLITFYCIFIKQIIFAIKNVYLCIEKVFNAGYDVCRVVECDTMTRVVYKPDHTKVRFMLPTKRLPMVLYTIHILVLYRFVLIDHDQCLKINKSTRHAANCKRILNGGGGVSELVWSTVLCSLQWTWRHWKVYESRNFM